jgi:hypothetical protein
MGLLKDLTNAIMQDTLLCGSASQKTINIARLACQTDYQGNASSLIADLESYKDKVMENLDSSTIVYSDSFQNVCDDIINHLGG